MHMMDEASGNSNGRDVEDEWAMMTRVMMMILKSCSAGANNNNNNNNNKRLMTVMKNCDMNSNKRTSNNLSSRSSMTNLDLSGKKAGMGRLWKSKATMAQLKLKLTPTTGFVRSTLMIRPFTTGTRLLVATKVKRGEGEW